MSHAHPLGPLADQMTHYARYRIGQDAMKAGFHTARRGRFAEAADLFTIAAHVAAILATATGPLDPERARRWATVAWVRGVFADQARTAAAAAADQPVDIHPMRPKVVAA